MLNKVGAMVARATTRFRPIVVLVGCAAAGALMAQYQVNTQLNPELYGHGVGSVRHTNVPWYRPTLPSDFRNSRFLSGSLPSDIRGSYLMEGPLAPSGALAYIPSSPRPYGSMSGPGRPLGMPRADRPMSVPGMLAPAPLLGSTRYAPYPGPSGGVLRYGPGATWNLGPYGSPRYAR